MVAAEKTRTGAEPAVSGGRAEPVPGENALRGKIREKMAAGALPRSQPPMMWAGPSSWKWKACAACGERIFEGEQEIELLVCCDAVYFHPRCHELWKDECS